MITLFSKLQAQFLSFSIVVGFLFIPIKYVWLFSIFYNMYSSINFVFLHWVYSNTILFIYTINFVLRFVQNYVDHNGIKMTQNAVMSQILTKVLFTNQLFLCFQVWIQMRKEKNKSSLIFYLEFCKHFLSQTICDEFIGILNVV